MARCRQPEGRNRSLRSVVIPISGPEKTEFIKLTNVAYVPDFLTNLVSNKLLKSRGVYVNTHNNVLFSDDEPVFARLRELDGHLFVNFGHDTPMELFQSSAFAVTSATPRKPITENRWHTKPLATDAHKRFVQQLCLVDIGTKLAPDGAKCKPPMSHLSLVTTLHTSQSYSPTTNHELMVGDSVKDWIREGKRKPEYVTTDKMLADGFTKPLSAQKFNNFRSEINVRPASASA
ncbi:hypothetical protein CFIMG_007572RA00001 [Ceratocystis fimbriata CBS 114723]|uniref:Uncharacterized protein n=1 Tax=Ceratocystis fimbriata CBS 114723 TaxID=1035309 RepID=A0A2C5X1Y9_9PEZI|nr:hypothetical protein CFIMG_007572RA00001 [Ceratocystis fimbriata CBS 114723]